MSDDGFARETEPLSSLDGQTDGTIAAPRPSRGRVVRRLVWGIAVTVLAGYIAVARVHIRLGVRAPAKDKDGSEYVWRSWWRARHDVVDIGSQQAVAAAYVGLGVIFLALCALACWVALVPDDSAADTNALSDLNKR